MRGEKIVFIRFKLLLIWDSHETPLLTRSQVRTTTSTKRQVFYCRQHPPRKHHHNLVFVQQDHKYASAHIRVRICINIWKNHGITDRNLSIAENHMVAWLIRGIFCGLPPNNAARVLVKKWIITNLLIVSAALGILNLMGWHLNWLITVFCKSIIILSLIRTLR